MQFSLGEGGKKGGKKWEESEGMHACAVPVQMSVCSCVYTTVCMLAPVSAVGWKNGVTEPFHMFDTN